MSLKNVLPPLGQIAVIPAWLGGEEEDEERFGPFLVGLDEDGKVWLGEFNIERRLLWGLADRWVERGTVTGYAEEDEDEP